MVMRMDFLETGVDIYINEDWTIQLLEFLFKLKFFR